MTSIALINVWLGPWPSNFEIWRKTAEYNDTIDFYIFTDNRETTDSKNIHFIYITMNEIKSIFEKEVGFKITLHKAYKICDYKMLFYLLLGEKIKEYDFWGYIDLDVVYGDIRKFLTDDFLEKYDRVFEQGNFTLNRNTDEINNLYKKSALKENAAYSYKDVFKNKYSCYFDEYMGMNILNWLYINDKVYRDQSNEKFMQDFSWQTLEFRSYNTNKAFVGKWQDGRLYRHFYNEKGMLNENESDEIMVMHVQKRKMKQPFDTTGLKNTNVFWIIPNTYQFEKPVSIVFSDEEKKQYEEQIRNTDKEKRIKNIKENGILDYIPHYIRSRKILHWINTVKKFY